MIRAALVACVFLSLSACGPKVPQHAGSKTRAPWKKAKPIKLEDGADKLTGELDYADYKRARWYRLDVPAHGDLALALEFTPTDDAGDATVALEVLDESFRVISEDPDAPVVEPEKSEDDEEEDEEEEEEEDDDGGDTSKTRQLTDLAPGRYLIHLFVTGRLDSAEYELAVTYTPKAAKIETDFPRQVPFVPELAAVPPVDDAPVVEERKRPRPTGPRPPRPPKPDPEPTGQAVTALVINAAASGSGTEITFNAGTDAGVAAGRKGTLAGVKNGGFTVSSCTARTCKATVKASIDEVNQSNKKVTIR